MKYKNVLLFAFLLGSFWIHAQIRAGVSAKSYDLTSVSITVDDFIITIDSQEPLQISIPRSRTEELIIMTTAVLISTEPEKLKVSAI